MRRPAPWAPPRVPTRSRDLQAAGVSHHKIADEVARGLLVQLRRGVYVAASAVPADPRERHLLHALAEQTADPRLVASHGTAGLLWGLPWGGEGAMAAGQPVLAAQRGGSLRSGSTRTARIVVTELPDHQVARTVAGLRVTTRSRTAVDIAAGSLPELLVTLDAALRAECQEIPSVHRRRDLENPRIHGAGRSGLLDAMKVARPKDADLHRALSLADPRRETPIESLSAGHFVLAELPLPIPQVRIHTVLGPVYPDFLWPEHRLIGEADGAVKYETRDAMLKEKEREQVLRDLGFTIVRWTGKEIRLRPALVVDRVARALAATG